MPCFVVICDTFYDFVYLIYQIVHISTQKRWVKHDIIKWYNHFIQSRRGWRFFRHEFRSAAWPGWASEWQTEAYCCCVAWHLLQEPAFTIRDNSASKMLVSHWVWSQWNAKIVEAATQSSIKIAHCAVPIGT
jgi:hypothetical protein